MSAANERLPWLGRIADDALDVGSRAGSSADRRRATPHWRRSRTRSPGCCARARAARPAPTVRANSGPRMISAPSSSACWAACCAPGALPPSSFTSSWMSGLLNSASAISAALRIDCAATAALPLADSGRIRPTLTLPSPILLVDCAGAGRLREPGMRSPTEKLPEQPASRTADASGGEPCGAWSRRRRGSRLQYSEHRRLLTQTARL